MGEEEGRGCLNRKKKFVRGYLPDWSTRLGQIGLLFLGAPFREHGTSKFFFFLSSQTKNIYTLTSGLPTTKSLV